MSGYQFLCFNFILYTHIYNLYTHMYICFGSSIDITVYYCVKDVHLFSRIVPPCSLVLSFTFYDCCEGVGKCTWHHDYISCTLVTLQYACKLTIHGGLWLTNVTLTVK